MQAKDIPRESGEAIAARLDRAHREARDLGQTDIVLAFDADGTLWSGDVGFDIFTALLASRRVTAAALAALEAEAQSIAISHRGEPLAIAEALFEAFEAGRYHEARAFAMMAWAFAGWTLAELESFAERVLAEARIEERLHRELSPILAWARAASVDVYVASASPRAAVEQGARALGIPRHHVLAMTPAVAFGVVEARLEGPVVYGEGKLEALRARRPHATLLGGFGDSSYDAALLRAAKVKVAVRPKESLLRVAHEVPGLVWIEG